MRPMTELESNLRESMLDELGAVLNERYYASHAGKPVTKIDKRIHMLLVALHKSPRKCPKMLVVSGGLPRT